MDQLSNLSAGGEVNIKNLLLNLAVGILMSLVLRWHYRKFGSTLSNRGELMDVFPFILLTTILIITVVKSSLALSLGLVGALSIVRFRTPIKEPEELAYLFIAIAIGLGLGANQTVITVIAGFAILVIMAFVKMPRLSATDKNLYLSIDCDLTNLDQDTWLSALTETIGKHTSVTDLRRLDVRGNTAEVVCFVDVTQTSSLPTLIADLRKAFPGIGVTFIDQNNLPSA